MFWGLNGINFNNMYGGLSQLFCGFPSFGCYNPVSTFLPAIPSYNTAYPLNPSLFTDGLGGISNSNFMMPSANTSIFSNTQYTNPFNLSFNSVPNFNPFNFSFNYQSKFKPKEQSSKETPQIGPYSKVSLSKIEEAGLKFDKPWRDRERWDKMDPEFQTKFLKLLEYAKSLGIKVTLTSGLRTQSEQQDLVKKGQPAAKTGSRHLTGRAADISVSGNRSKNLALLGEYWKKELKGRWGQDFENKKKNFPPEPWHFDVG